MTVRSRLRLIATMYDTLFLHTAPPSTAAYPTYVANGRTGSVREGPGGGMAWLAVEGRAHERTVATGLSSLVAPVEPCT